MAQITIKDFHHNPMETVEAEIMHDVFALYMKDEKWQVTHIISGWHLHGVQGPFDKRESAVAYIEALAAGRVMWYFETEQQMYEFNNRAMLEAVVNGARLMAGMA